MTAGAPAGKASIRSIIRAEIWNYEKTRPLPPHIRNAAKRIFLCKTRAAGHHVHMCENGHEHVRWNSCQHRSCPECAWPAKKRWLKKTEKRLIDRPHHHFIFTFADELNDLWLANQVELRSLLFRTVKKTLFALFGDEQYCGGTPGVIAVLHTWGRPLTLHPHLHCIVTRGGMDETGKWRDSRRKSALPLPPYVVSRLFRGKYLAAIRKGLATGMLKLPENVNNEDMNNRIAAAYAKDWSIFIGRAGGRVQTIVNYLGRYVCGGPIGKSRIKECADGKVTFLFRNYRVKGANGRPEDRPLTLTRHEFLRRWFLHVPESGAKNVRSFGLYSPSYKGPKPGAAPGHEDDSEQPETPSSALEEMKCPHCGAPLKTVAIVQRPWGRSPPLGRLG